MQTEDLHDPNSLSLDEFLWVLAQVPILRAWATTIESAAMRKLLDGEKLPGYKLVEGRANRKWTDLKKPILAMMKLGFTENEVAPRELISPAQAEKLLKKTKRSKEFGRISKFMERPRGKASIASEDDPRPEYVRGEEFTDETLETDEE